VTNVRERVVEKDRWLRGTVDYAATNTVLDKCEYLYWNTVTGTNFKMKLVLICQDYMTLNYKKFLENQIY